jgi:hypothetical protein
MTTFRDPRLVRERLGTLFTAYSGDGQPLQIVFSNWPKVGEAKGLSPFIVITSDSTEQDFESLNVNPVKFGLTIAVFVQSGSPIDSSINRADAMDKINQIDTLIRQVVRNNAGDSNWDNIYFSGKAVVSYTPFETLPYIVQPFPLIVELANGA